MNERRRGLGRGLGALIPSSGDSPRANRPSDVFFSEQKQERESRFADALTPHSDSRDPEREGRGRHAARYDFAETAAAVTSSDAGSRDDEAAKLASSRNSDVTQDLKPVPGASFAEIAPSRIRPNPKQPRSVFDEDHMAELVHSIREIGVLQPIVVRPVPADDPEVATTPYELIMGERRWRATQKAGLEAIPVIIRSTTDEDLLRDALLENLHRSQLNPLEEAAAYAQLLEDFGCTHDELAARIGRSRPQISNTIRLMKLPPLVQRRVAAGVLSAGHARALLGLSNPAAMERLAQRIVAEGLSVRSVEEIVAVGEDKKPRSRAVSRETAPEIEDWATSLADKLDTRVGVSMGKNRGKLTVEFASVEDLGRIMDALGINRG